MTAMVDGEPLWFESDDIELARSAEAYASALLVASCERSCPLTMEDGVGAAFAANVGRLLPVVSGWWGYAPAPLSLRVDSAPRPARGDITALCFSGGVDSFFTLLRSGRRIDLLVFVLGFDVPLADAARFHAIETSLREVARESGARAVVLRTNLREHPAFAPVSWERTHGGALAAVGHLLGDSAGTLLISSSYGYGSEEPWGSHWQIDRHWSSERLEVAHVGAEHGREEKLRAIAAEPLVRRFLRVCWENLEPVGNCSRCEKCVRTRLILEDCGELAASGVFRDARSLAADLDALPPSSKRMNVYRRLGVRPHLNWRVRRAIRRLLARKATW